MSRSRITIFRIATVILSLFLFFLSCEVSIRIAILFKKKNDFSEYMCQIQPLKAGQTVGLAQLLQPNANPRMIYELKPYISVVFADVEVETNGQGWRSSREVDLEKGNRTIRIFCLGDSHMFGWGVPANQNLPGHLELELNRIYPARRWEVINAAVPGYNAAMEVETLEKKCLKYRPDIVILEFIGNDLNLPNFIYAPDNPLSIHELYFPDFVYGRIRLALFCRQFKHVPMRVPAPDIKLKSFLTDRNYFRLRSSTTLGPVQFEIDPGKVPPLYRDLVGWKGYGRAMDRLKVLRDKYGFALVYLITCDKMNEKIFNTGKSSGFHTIYNAVYDPTDPSLVVSEKDPHPSALCHGKTADLLLRFMDREGIIEEQMKKTANF